MLIQSYKCRKCSVVVKSRTLPTTKNKGCIDNGRHNWVIVKHNIFIKLINALRTDQIFKK